jgi:putative MATE family efflux protein
VESRTPEEERVNEIREARLVEGSIARTLARLTAPMIVGILGIVAFNLVDTYFVGQLGIHELAAMGFTFPVVFVVNGLALGLGMGTSAVVSRAIGRGDPQEVRRLTTDGLALALLAASLLATAGLATIGPVFRLLGATPEVLSLIRSYMRIWYPGTVFVVIPMVGNNAIRATGDTKTPAIIMLVAVAVNLVMDPLLIFGIGPFPRLELAGAAIATVIARATVFCVASWVLSVRERMITWAVPGLRAVWHSWRRILYIGIPSGTTNIIVPLGMGAVTRIVSAYGPEAVAGFGVAARVERFALTIVMALSSVLAPFVGQNWGAGRRDRVRLGITYSTRFATAWGVSMLVLLGVGAKPIGAVFNDDPAVVSAVALYLWIVPVSYGLWGVFRLSNVALNVLNRPLQAAFLNVLQLFVLYIPLAILGSHLVGLRGVFGAATVANVLSGAAAYVWLGRVLTAVEPELPSTAMGREAAERGQGSQKGR